ncbi:hypothetical protein [Bordetella muralis]|jgi:hypothetical protein|uniref:hypothetical protein n=1 Tax=Bordetella muralis TaxID=1649130 RepID=UPI0039EF879C
MPVGDHYAEFSNTLAVSKRLRDKANNPGSGIEDSERFLLYEAIFLRVFRAYENFLEEVFLSYLTGEVDMSGNAIACFVAPRDRGHAREMVVSSQQFLDWTSPSVVMERSGIYINGGEPVRTAIAASQQYLLQAKKIRNHIAHNSKESEREFSKVVLQFLLTPPIQPPSVGEFLIKIPNAGPAKRKEILAYFMESLESTVRAIVVHP